MPCYSPLEAYYGPENQISFKVTEGYGDRPLKLPCGQCIGCRLEQSRQWAIRCVHENQMHNESCFVTLTYDDEHLPETGSLERRHVQLFFKRLRKKYGKLRTFYCGEYGETTSRPHYHALIFGWRPTDGKKLTNEDPPIYESEQLADVWGLGMCSFGEVTFESAAYTARYVTKKITGPMAKEHYTRTNLETGEIFELTPEFSGQSRRPGIGIPFIEKYGKDIYEKDQIIARGMPMRPPRAYDKWAEHNLPELWRTVRRKRQQAHQENHPAKRDPSETYKGSFNHFRAQIKIAHDKLGKRDEHR